MKLQSLEHCWTWSRFILKFTVFVQYIWSFCNDLVKVLFSKLTEISKIIVAEVNFIQPAMYYSSLLLFLISVFHLKTHQSITFLVWTVRFHEKSNHKLKCQPVLVINWCLEWRSKEGRVSRDRPSHIADTTVLIDGILTIRYFVL